MELKKPSDLKLIMIVAAARNDAGNYRVIGYKGKIPWEDDLRMQEVVKLDRKRFRTLTLDHPIIMGRVSFELLPENYKPLPRRTNIVVSKKPKFSIKGFSDGVIVARNLEEAIKEAYNRTKDKRAFVIGGQDIYYSFMQHTDEIDITEIHEFYKGDRLFPKLFKKDWREFFREDHKEYSFVSLKRK